ncbi:MAG: hypothetical protein EBR79_00635 [Proteobacteria bacterium]|nr:hypothetical protein [Pseudomonadota bacterium]NBX85806.1 hypothetical protein [Pseudomonadota bacterium]
MGLQIGKASLSAADRIDFFKTLSGWLNAGAGQNSVAEAVKNTCAAFSHDEYSTLAPQMDTIQREVENGQTPLYQALAIVNVGFKPQELAVVEAAERSNQLRVAIPSLVAALEVQSQGRRDLWMKLAGPLGIGIMLVLLSLGVLIIMLPMVIQPVLDRKPESLYSFPFILQWFWAASVWLRANPFLIPAILVVLIGLFLARNTPTIRPYWLKFMLYWGVSRKLIIGFNALVVVYFLPALVRSGMPTYQVLEQLANCVTNPVISSLLMAAAEDHRNGLRMSVAVEPLPFRAAFVNAVQAGESTGAIAERVEDLQVPFKLELERYIRQVTSTIKFVVMAVLLPFFILSTYTSLVGPIFALMEYR